MPKKPSKYGIKIWIMCDCSTKYMMGAKVYLGKENNEVAGGLASDVDCKLVQPISGQDRSGRNVTTDNFFTSVDLANQLKNKALTLFGTMKQNKIEIPQEFKPAKQRDETRLFLDLPRISHLCIMSQRRTNQLSSFHHSITFQPSAAIQESLKSSNFITKQKVH